MTNEITVVIIMFFSSATHVKRNSNACEFHVSKIILRFRNAHIERSNEIAPEKRHFRVSPRLFAALVTANETDSVRMLAVKIAFYIIILMFYARLQRVTRAFA